MIVLKLVLYIAIILVWILVWKTVSLGRMVKRIPRANRSQVPYKEHRKYAGRLWRTTLFLVVLVEVLVRMRGGVKEWDFLLFFHVSSGIAFLLSLFFLRFVFPGGSNPRIHRPLSYIMIFFMLAVTTTAFPVIWRM